jgi:hypothetical protein
MECVERRSRDHTSGDTTQVGRRLRSSQMWIVIKTQVQAGVNLSAFCPGGLTKHR